MTDDLHLSHLGACRTAFKGSPEVCGRVLFLGEDNPQSAAPEHALFPYPPGCAGHRLCNDVLAVFRHTYLATWRTNLCVGKWSTKKARERAAALIAYSAPWDVIVLLGRKVTDVFAPHLRPAGGTLDFFGVGRAAAVTSAETPNHPMIAGYEMGRPIHLVFLPHPSGRNLIWNDPRRALDARALLAEVVPEYPWGEASALAQTSHCRNWVDE